MVFTEPFIEFTCDGIWVNYSVAEDHLVNIYGIRSYFGCHQGWATSRTSVFKFVAKQKQSVIDPNSVKWVTNRDYAR